MTNVIVVIGAGSIGHRHSEESQVIGFIKR